MARFFFVLSRILLASMFVMAIISPVSAQENEPETTCVEEEDLLRCTVWVNEFDNGPMFALEITEDQTPINAITFTSMTCDDWNYAPHEYAADPHIWLYSVDSEEILTLIADDDDSAPHNDGSNMCWDSQLTPTLDIGSYQLKADAFDTDYIGTYTMELSGGVWSLINDSEPAPDPEATPEPEPTPEATPQPTPEPVEPTPQPDPTPEESPTPEEEVEPPVDEPIQDPTPLPEEPEEEPEPDPPLEPPTVQPSLPPAPAPPLPVEENPPPPVTIDIEELEELPLEDDIMWNFDDIEWEEFELDELPEIEFVPEEIEAEEEEETTFFDDGEQAQPDEVQSDVELEEEFVLEEFEDIEEVDFEELDADELDDEIIAEILQDEETVEIFLEEVLEDNPDFFEDASDEQITVIFESAPELFNEASDEVKDELEAEINVYAGGFEDYVPEDSTISVDERRSIIAVTTATATIATVAVTRPTPPPPTPRPTTPTPPRPSSPSAVSPSGPTIRRNNDKA